MGAIEVLTFVEFDVELSQSYTFRFAHPQEDIPFDSIPALESVSVTPAVVDPGKSIGQRASVNVAIKDFMYPLEDTDFDTGTFFGKLRARKRSLQGSALRIIRGTTDQDISEMHTEHYVIESLMRTSGDIITIVAKDLLKVADGDRAQAPAASNGRLLADISAEAILLTLTPAGIGEEEYPYVGKVAIGGSEICTFTRAIGSDQLSLTRAWSNTEAKEHEADEVVQIVLEFESQSPADIIYVLFTGYTDIDPSWLPLDEWRDDIDTYIGRLYSAQIAQPTGVSTLINELIEQTGLVMWWDQVNQKVRLKSLRPVTGAREILANEMLEDTFSYQEQPAKRVSQVWTHFALRNPLAKLDDVSNYLSTLISLDADAENDYGQSAIRKIFSRWIALNNRPAASRLNTQILSRFRDPPRRIRFDLFRTSDSPSLGQGLEVGHWSLQDANGNEELAPVQVTALELDEDRYGIETEEMLFTNIDDPENPGGGTSDARIVIIDNSVFNVNLRTLHDSFYTPATSGMEIICQVDTDAIVGSTDITLPAFDVGTWPAGIDITLRIKGRIQGKGGAGGAGGIIIPFVVNFPAQNGFVGGPALYTRYPITLDNEGAIYGGSGGGGGGTSGTAESFTGVQGPGGGGGAGTNGGAGGFGTASGQPGTSDEGGISGGALAGAGGGPGLAGSGGSGAGATVGGNPGSAIDGVSYVTVDTAGTIVGPQVN